jgi:crotonobetainyl-CoA:carnitine CoA-transferase CaiB-like acyl-CoA transferase
MAKAPLSGIRVIEFGQVIAAPFACALLADFGAEVIKVEPPSGDTMRALGPKSGATSAWWRSIARSKRLFSIDWKQPKFRSTLERLVRRSDVLVENFRPGVLERNGLSPEQLHQWNPDLVILRISGFGQTGPYSHRPGFGKIAEAFSGVCDLTGFADGPPVHPGFPMADTSTGLMGAFGVVLALLAVERGHSRGQIIDLPIYEAPLRMAEFPVPMRTGGGTRATRNGNRQPLSFALSGAYRSKDGRWVTYSAASYSVARRVLCILAGNDFAAQPCFETMEGICAIDDEIDVMALKWMAERTADEIVTQFSNAGAAAGPVMDVNDIIADPHIRARDNIADVNGDPCKIINVVPKLSATPGSIRWLGKDAIGADTEAILSDTLGFSRDEVRALLETKNIAAE